MRVREHEAAIGDLELVDELEVSALGRDPSSPVGAPDTKPALSR